MSTLAVAAPDEIRAAREANGWSVEQMAGALWVSPLEVVAWEAGSIAPSRQESGWIRWHAQMGARDRALAQAGLNPCAWVRDRIAQYPPERRGTHPSDLYRPEIALHVQQCRACCPSPLPDLLRSPAPEPPRSEDTGWVDRLIGGWRRAGHLSLPGRIGWRVLVPAGLLAAGLLLLESATWAEDGFDLPLKPFLISFAGYLVFLLTGRPLRSFGEDHPWLAWQARTAAVLVSMLLVWGGLVESVMLESIEVWTTTGAISALIGWVAGAIAMDHHGSEEYLRKTVTLTTRLPGPADPVRES